MPARKTPEPAPAVCEVVLSSAQRFLVLMSVQEVEMAIEQGQQLSAKLPGSNAAFGDWTINPAQITCYRLVSS